MDDILQGGTSWQADLGPAFEAAKIGLAAETSVRENRRIHVEGLVAEGMSS